MNTQDGRIYYIVYLYFSLPFLTVAYTQVSSNLQKPFNNIFYLQFSFLTMPANQRSYNKLQAKKFSWQNVQIILLLLLFFKKKNMFVSSTCRSSECPLGAMKNACKLFSLALQSLQKFDQLI